MYIKTLPVLLAVLAAKMTFAAPGKLTVGKGDSIVLVGTGLASRMEHFGHFETELYLAFPDSNITIRNIADEGNTPGFCPHPGRNYDGQYAFPGAKELVHPAYKVNTSPSGHFETPDQWLGRLKADTILAFFGTNSSFDGPEHVERYKKELDAYLKHTLKQNYNGNSAPKVALISPTAFQDLSNKYDTPDGKRENSNLSLYTSASKEVADQNNVLFVDVFNLTAGWYGDGKEYTNDGALLNDEGYRKLAPALVGSIFQGGKAPKADRSKVHASVNEKVWMWRNDFKIPNGVHVYGRRYNPYGPANYPFELQKTREMTANRDQAIWATLQGKKFDLAAADAKTSTLPKVETNFSTTNAKNGNPEYLTGKESAKLITTAEGYKMELFASNDDFPDLANPVQMAFDNKGRLWVATMATYPHYLPGDTKPKDKLVILEDTDCDGKADKQTNWADDLHIPMGFEIAHDGVYVSQSGSLVFLQDTDNDDHYDKKTVIYSGFDDHDTHHAIAAFCADPAGAIYMAEGVFLHSNVETAYGPSRGTNGGFFRYSPQQKHLMRYSQFQIPNPWGIAFDDYGQDFFLHTSGTSFSWMMPGSQKNAYGVNLRAPDILTSNKVRPTSGLEFVSSRHFPDDVQGDVLLCNAIGYLGCKQHKMKEDGTGFTTEYRQDLFKSDDRNFRPVDLEFAPDGSLYVVDWHNVLIGHMQHNARDPHRDHTHGRIYRVTYPGRPLVEPAQVAGASIDTLLENLKLPEYRTRYRTRRELRGHDANEVAKAAAAWADKQTDERLKLEALWVSWGANKVNQPLLRQLLQSKDHRIRSAAVRVLRFNTKNFNDYQALVHTAANDEHGRVRLEAITTASYFPKDAGLATLAIAQTKGIDKVMEQTFKAAQSALKGEFFGDTEERPVQPPKHLKGKDGKLFTLGASVYARDAHCGTCHQSNGAGLPAAGFPPLNGSEWVTGDPERLIKISLKGLLGPIEVKGQKYPGFVPMTPFEHLLKDDELAGVLTYIRNSFGNKASVITPEEVAKVREQVKSHIGFYNPADLLK